MPSHWASAEQKFYTWVDEMGRVHNVPIGEATKENPPSFQPDSNKKNQRASQEKSPAPFLSEEEFEKQHAQDLKDRAPFFTWTDGQGQLRSEPIPQVSVEATEAEIQITDHTLLRSFRIPEAAALDCCAQLSGRFKHKLEPFKRMLLDRPHKTERFMTASGAVAAWYFYTPGVVATQEQEYPTLSIKIRDTEAQLSLIALDKDLQPLHFITALQTQYQPETWRQVAYYESLVSVADNEVVAFILYFKDEKMAKSASLEVKWLN